MSQAGSIVVSGTVPSDVATSYVTDSGTATPSANVLNVLGGTGTTTSGSGDTITITNTSTSSFTPNAILQEFDDFISPPTSGGKLQWNFTQPGGLFGRSFIDGTSNNPGICGFIPTSGANFSQSLISQNFDLSYYSPFALGGGIFSVNWVIQLSALSSGGNTYRFTCGLADATSLSTPTDSFVDGVYFEYTDSVNSGNWTINCTKTSVTTTANTSTAATTDFVNLGITVNAGGTSVSFFVNGTEVANSPITTNIPTAPIAPFFMAINTAGTTPQINADLFYVQYTLTTPR